MRSIMIIILAASSAASAAPPDWVSEASGAALQADVRHALDIMKGVDALGLEPKDAQFLSCMTERFSRTPERKAASSNLADRALAIYQSYWHAALMRPDTRAAEERRLDASLRKMLYAGKSADLDSLLEKRIEASGHHSLEGRTGLLRELMVWDKQDERLVPVQLPEGEYRVKVVLLNGFRSFGWSYYATCGRRATGGWTTDKALYAVVPRYHSLDDEEFRVTFLGHEAQHFADKSRFRKLRDWELEYRAKLTELALAQQTRTKVLGKFIEDQGDDPASPHSFADRKILKDLMARLGINTTDALLTADAARLQSTAKTLLIEDSARRTAAGDLKDSVRTRPAPEMRL